MTGPPLVSASTRLLAILGDPVAHSLSPILHNAAMRADYQRQPIGTGWTVGARENTGDGIAAGHRAGAALALMDDAWWGPTIPLPGGPYLVGFEDTLERQHGETVMRGDRLRGLGRPFDRARVHGRDGEPGQAR